MTESKLQLNTNAADVSENDLRERYSEILGKKVPDLLDYSENSTLIDFTKDLNAQLYALIGLTADEINFIETAIKPME